MQKTNSRSGKQLWEMLCLLAKEFRALLEAVHLSEDEPHNVGFAFLIVHLPPWPRPLTNLISMKPFLVLYPTP